MPDSSLERIHQKARQISEGYGHYYLGTEHVFLAVLLEEPVLADVLSEWGVHHGPFVERVLDISERGEGPPLWSGFPISPRLKRVEKLAEREARDGGAREVQAGHLVAAILSEGRGIPARVLREMGVELGALRSDLLERIARGGTGGRPLVDGAKRELQGMHPPLDLADIMGDVGNGKKPAPAQPAAEKAPEKNRKEKPSVLGEFAQNLTAMAREGKLSPVIGRKEEIRRCLEVLTRKGKNNPVLIGEAGVGKTSVALGIAQRIAAGKVPEVVRDRQIWELSMTRLVAGASYRGEFQDRLQKIMDEVKERPDVILFIDEIHMLVGAGDHKGGMDAGNILKPALARGDFPVIGATTTDEYRRTIEPDPALERRFHPVLVAEPSEQECLEILQGLRGRYEQHHGVRITDRALLAAVKLSTRFLPDRSLPDKAIDLIDEAASKVKLQACSMSIAPEVEIELEVGDDAVAEVVSNWSGVPVGRLTEEEGERLLHIEDALRARVIGQDAAVRVVAQTIRVMRVGLGSPNRPGGVFLFLGATGVGKTELARALAENLFGSEKDLIRLDMSEYMEKHAVARLIGSPPGYVGHEEEGQLTRAVRTRPYSVVLLDEVEKAHPEVFDLFLQVFDDGRLTDSKGRTVNFTNTVIILTSNLGSGGPPGDPADEAYLERVEDALRQKFRPEFLNRIDERVYFLPLDRGALEKILDLQLAEVAKRVREQRQIMLAVEPDARALILRKGYSPEYGARPMRRAVQSLLVKPLAEFLLGAAPGPGDLVVARAAGDTLRFSQEDFAEAGSDEAPPPADLGPKDPGPPARGDGLREDPSRPARGDGGTEGTPQPARGDGRPPGPTRPARAGGASIAPGRPKRSKQEESPPDLEKNSRSGTGPARQILDAPVAPPHLLESDPHQTEDGTRPVEPSSFRPHETGSKGKDKGARPGRTEKKDDPADERPFWEDFEFDDQS